MKLNLFLVWSLSTALRVSSIEQWWSYSIPLGWSTFEYNYIGMVSLLRYTLFLLHICMVWNYVVIWRVNARLSLQLECACRPRLGEMRSYKFIRVLAAIHTPWNPRYVLLLNGFTTRAGPIVQLRGSPLHAIEIGDTNLNAIASIKQTHMGNSTPLTQKGTEWPRCTEVTQVTYHTHSASHQHA